MPMTHFDRIDAVFLQHACDILADTEHGLSGGVIVKVTAAHALDHLPQHQRLPHPTYPFQAANKRAALFDNLRMFDGPHQVQLLLQLCDHARNKPENLAQRQQLKLRILRDYSGFAPAPSGSDGLAPEIVDETRHWLDPFPECRKLFDEALRKRAIGVLERNLLDDLRLALELLVKRILGNDKSLEHQLAGIAALATARGGSPEIGNLMHRAADYFGKYQNSYIKHSDAVKAHEVDFVIEWAVMLMRHLLRLQAAGAVPAAPDWPPRP